MAFVSASILSSELHVQLKEIPFPLLSGPISHPGSLHLSRDSCSSLRLPLGSLLFRSSCRPSKSSRFPSFNARLGAPRDLRQRAYFLPVSASSAIWHPAPALPQCFKVTNYLLIARTNKPLFGLMLFDLSAALDALLNSFYLKSYPPAVSRPRATWLLSEDAVPSQSPSLVPFLSPFAKCGPCPRCNPQLSAVFMYSHSPSGHLFPGVLIIWSNYSSRLPTAFGRKSKLLRMVYKALHDLVSHLTSLPLPLLFLPFPKSYHFKLTAVLQRC